MPIVKKQQPSIRKGGSKNTAPKSGWDMTEGLKMLIYGQSGSGKTTFCSTFPGEILWLICSGGSRPGELKSIDTPANRKRIKAMVIESTDQIKDMLVDANKYNLTVLDHVSGLQDLTLKEILGLDELPVQKSWGMATQQEYGQSTMQCKEILRAILGLENNVVIVGQEREFKNEGDSELIQPTVGVAVSPSLAGWLNPAVDYVGQMFKRPVMIKSKVKMGGKEKIVVRRGTGVEYCLRTEPHDVYATKFRIVKGKPLPACIVDPSYDKIMKLING